MCRVLVSCVSILISFSPSQCRVTALHARVATAGAQAAVREGALARLVSLCTHSALCAPNASVVDYVSVSAWSTVGAVGASVVHTGLPTSVNMVSA